MRSAAQILVRGFVLFLIGLGFSFAIITLFVQRHFSHLSPYELISSIVQEKWWLSLICGAVSAVVGLVYPYLEHKCGDQHVPAHEWSGVLRCVAVFIGINEACVKIDFPSNLQLSLSLAILSVGLWWYFDHTGIGFIMGLSISLVTMLVTQVLVYHEVCTYSETEFMYVKSWLPSVVFSGGITVGNIGKQLAVNDFMNENKKHME